MTSYNQTLSPWGGTAGDQSTTQNVTTSDTVVCTLSTNGNTWGSSNVTNCSRSPTSGSAATTCTVSFSSTGSYSIRFYYTAGGKNPVTYYHDLVGTVSGGTPTLTAVDISPATVTINDGAGSQAFTASITGSATDTVYAWTITGDTDNATLSSSSGNPVTVTTTNDADESQETITVTVSATSSGAGVSSGVTDTTTITLNHTTTPIGVSQLNNQEVTLQGVTENIGVPPLNNQEVGLIGDTENTGAKPREISRSSAPIQRW